jgi:hypothetical protein
VDHDTCVGQQELVGRASERHDVRVGGLIGGRRHSGEGRRCGGRRGFQGGPAHADGDEGGSATTKRRREALGEVAHQEDRFDGGTVMAQPSSGGQEVTVSVIRGSIGTDPAGPDDQWRLI